MDNGKPYIKNTDMNYIIKQYKIKFKINSYQINELFIFSIFYKFT